MIPQDEGQKWLLITITVLLGLLLGVVFVSRESRVEVQYGGVLIADGSGRKGMAIYSCGRDYLPPWRFECVLTKVEAYGGQ